LSRRAGIEELRAAWQPVAEKPSDKGERHVDNGIEA
jgi:hypothetical protein